jgi:predicted transcriptional regulator
VGGKKMIDKTDFEVIFWIESMGYNNPDLLSEQMDWPIKEAEKYLLRLEQEGLIKIEYKENKIYSSQLTVKGREIYEDRNYKTWKEELGY